MLRRLPLDLHYFNPTGTPPEILPGPGTSFQLKLDTAWIGRDSLKLRLWNRFLWFAHRFLYFIKCTPTYDMVVLSDPEPIEDGYVYEVQIRLKVYRIFGIRVLKVPTPNFPKNYHS